MKLLLWFALLKLALPASQGQDKAALIVGGSFDTVPGLLDSVELFGCDGLNSSLALPDYPLPINYAGGTFIPTENKALVCGGLTCDDDIGSCQVNTADCYSLQPGQTEWKLETPMFVENFGFLMTLAPNLDQLGQDLTPLIILRDGSTIIYDGNSGVWLPYRPLDDESWSYGGCLAVSNDKVYHITDKVKELNPKSWDLSVVDYFVPAPLDTFDKCSGLVLDNHFGVMTRVGYFYDLNAKAWIRKSFPLLDLIFITFGETFTSLNGRPTHFGFPVCDDYANCQHKRV